MVKPRGKGRGRGPGRGRPTAGGRQPGQATTGTTSQGAVQRSPSTVQAFLSRFSGPRGSQLITAEQRDQVIQWIAHNASSSLSTSESTTTSQFSAPPHPAALSPVPQPGPSRESTHSEDAYSQELFSGPLQLTPEAPEELLCTDAQPFNPSQPESEECGDCVLMSQEVLEDDDETQLSSSKVVEGAGTCQGGQDEDSEEELLDDEVTDPSWVAEPHHDSGSEEEGEEAASEPVARVSGVVTGRSRAAKKISVTKASYRKPKSSAVWEFFSVSEVDIGTVVCNLCHSKLSRGGTKSNFTTTSMRKHMQAKHPSRWTASCSPAGTGDATAMSAHVEMRSSTPVPGTSTSRPAPTPSPTQSSLESTLASKRSFQLSLQQTLERKRKYAANHPHAQNLTVHIAKLLSLEMLPYRLVETVAFRKLMAVASPRYLVPSRHFFSRCAVPSLQQHVTDNIIKALSNAVADRVHLTTDTWTSGSGQGHYISVTAHWVNLVEAGTETDSGSSHVLPTPRLAGPNSVTVSPAYYASDPTSTPSSPSSPSTSQATSKTTPHSVCSLGRVSNAVAKRQQAVLKLLSLGDRRHTAPELLQGISQEANRWFQPLSLQTGMVVCDNGRNLVAALQLGQLIHVPCMAHVLNLVVQRFLKTYPGLSQFLVKVRRISAHFRKSTTDAATLRTLQQRLKLPIHRLICDVPTRWNSTLHMLARLHDQRRAIVEFQLQHAHLSVSQPPHITFEEWPWMSNLCLLLATFEESTRMVSGDADIISVTIPLICLLRQSLDCIRSHGQRSSQEFTYQDTVDEEFEEEEEEEEEEEVRGFGEQATHDSSITSIQRAWPEEEEEEESEELADSLSTSAHSDLNPVKSLGHMVDFILACLSRDPRITAIMGNPDFWVFSLLDPRYKENLSSLIPAGERSVRLHHYHTALVEKLLAHFPSDYASSRARTSGASVPGERCESGTMSRRGRGTLSMVFARFVSTQPEGPNPQVVMSRRQKFKNMVKEYTCDRTIVLQDASAPYNFWVSKLNVWHELSLYALEVLACPAASVLSERVFSAAGGIITDKRTRLSTESADRLTFIKMNHQWISKNFAEALVESRDT